MQFRTGTHKEQHNLQHLHSNLKVIFILFFHPRHTLKYKSWFEKLENREAI